jgi:hypothetical protein
MKIALVARRQAPRRGSTSPSERKALHFSVKPEASDRAPRPAAEQRNVEIPTVVALAPVRVRPRHVVKGMR